MKIKSKIKSILSAILAVSMLLTLMPTITFASQASDYVDPADIWLKANGRTNELDLNATTTYETSYCTVCERDTLGLTYRVPEYTKSGETALNRGVKYSDGTLISGNGTGNLDDGTPGIDAYYTGYQWTKSVCQTCGTMNSVDGADAYSFNKNVYILYSCDHNFFYDFDNTTYEPYNDTYHTSILKKGQYCQFCKGTRAQASESREHHNFNETIDAQLGNSRFYVTESCDDCGYETTEYLTAKSVVSSYYGVEDGMAHTVTVSDLSDAGVHTSIRYGTKAGSCNLTSAPNYTNAGYYPIYYEIDYEYDGENMIENGVSYVWLLDENSNNDSSSGNSGESSTVPHVHDYRYVETVAPTCTDLGFERWQCDGCGRLEKRNYTPATGHAYEDITIREATCKQGGLILTLCKKCGDFHEETTPTGSHSYTSEVIAPTCRNVGYTEYTCTVCGDTYMDSITPIISHAFERITKEPTCTDQGYTTSTCTMCGLNYVSDYTDPIGHSWDEGTEVTSPTCTGEGVVEHHCQNNGCDEKMIKAESATGHTPGAEATCTTPQLCEVCGTVLAQATGHHYETEIVAPTCAAMGYTVYTCPDCGDSYTSNYTDKAEHDYNAVVTNPTCTEHGYTTYTCNDCGDEYISDYTEKLPHSYEGVVTQPTCTEMGYTTYTCSVCGDSYIADYTEMTEHNYSQQVIPPTCTEHGYTIYTCPDCGKEYIGDLTDCEQHHYIETVTPPTCTEMGYTTFVCESCGDSYKDNYTDKLPHDYDAVVTAPTCTEMGYTTYTCKSCGDSYVGDYTDKTAHSYETVVTEPTCLTLGYTTYTCSACGHSYKAEYKEPLGHSPSEWIIDIPATIESAGSKHIECLTCGTVLQTVEIPQLVDTDHSDEDGDAEVGDYSIILTDENGKPVFDSEITIDVEDNVTIKLPDGRLLDYEDRTTITAFHTDTQEPAAGLQIFIYDKNNNAATGSTDKNGQLVVPNNQSSTGDDNGTVGTDDGDEKKTYVVTVTDKTNVIIPNCDIYIGESNNLVVDLADGVKPTRENPVIVTVTDQNGNAQKGVTIIALGDADFIEKGVTDIYGKLTLPTASDGYTDEDGKVNVEQINVIVNDELGVIPNAYVVYNEDDSISVTLPEGKTITHANRITVTVLDSVGNPIAGKTVTVTDLAESSYTGITDETGRIIVPPVTEDYTDSDGKGVVNGYNVLITDETKPIENAFITITDGKLNVKLPEGVLIDIENRITATVTDSENKPVKDMSVTFTDSTEKSETNLTNENGQATVPPTNIDYTDVNGYCEVDGYIVTVVNETGAIEKAFVTLSTTQSQPDASGNITEIENISVQLPAGIAVDDHANRVTVTVLNKADNTPVSGMPVIITETAEQTEQPEETPDVSGSEESPAPTEEPESTAEPDATGESDQSEGDENPETSPEPSEPERPVSASGVTDKNGKVTVPPLSEDVTGDDGNGDITEDKPSEDTDGDGEPDTGDTETSYTVTVTNNDGNIANALVKIEDGKITVTLPDTHTLTTSNQTTVTVLDKDGEPVQGVSVTVKDKSTSKSGTTNSQGKVTLPVKSTGGGGTGGGGSSSGGGGGGGWSSSYNSVNVKVTDKDGKTVSVSKSTGTDKVTLTLPTGKSLDDDNWYTITVTDRNGKAKANYTVVLKDRNGNEITGTTDNNGIVILPAQEHKAYIVGYEDGTFRPDGDMTRAEAATIFARLISEAKGESVSGNAGFSDVSQNDWFAAYVGYLAKYDVIKGYEDGTFRPNASVTRAEFVAMAVRCYDLFYELGSSAISIKYNDLNSSHWAYDDIAYATNEKWLNGYADGSFKPDVNITRAEVVTVVNRATGRTPDKEFINDNLAALNKFTDLKSNAHWGYYDIMESANDHMAIVDSEEETWVK